MRQGAVFGWRIATDTPTYQADDRTGKGAELSGGRWNHPSTPLLYISTSRALACLETPVHLQAGPLPLKRYLVEFEVPAAVWCAREVFDLAAHVGWDAEPPGQVSIVWGTEWVQQRRTIVAEVPSVVVLSRATCGRWFAPRRASPWQPRSPLS